MTNSSKPPPNAGKFLNRELLKANLSFAALFLTAFELLKLSVIGAVENVLAWFPEDAKQIERYEAELGIRFDQRDERGLLPSANWLFRIDVLTQDEIEVIKAIDEECARQGRNHGIILMADLGDLREGFWDKDELVRAALLIEKQLKHVHLLGVGTNLGCYGSINATPDKMEELVAAAESALAISQLARPSFSTSRLMRG